MPLALLNISLLLYIAARTALWTEQAMKHHTHNVIQIAPERPSALKELSSSFSFTLQETPMLGQLS